MVEPSTEKLMLRHVLTFVLIVVDPIYTYLCLILFICFVGIRIVNGLFGLSITESRLHQLYSLLYRIIWDKMLTYVEIVRKYQEYFISVMEHPPQ